jgi:citrate synthase
MQQEIGTDITHDKIKDYLWKTLRSGQVVPGYARQLKTFTLTHISSYGHGVLRSPDPRFMALQQFCDARPDLLKDPVIDLVKKVYFSLTCSVPGQTLYFRHTKLPLMF